MYRILKQEGRAKRAVFDTVHGSEPRWNFPILIIFM